MAVDPTGDGSADAGARASRDYGEADKRLRSIRIEGFKSIREATVELGPLNILIGENGSGKSNFVEVFRLIHAISDGTLDAYSMRIGANNLLFLGREVTPRAMVQTNFASSDVRFHLDGDSREELTTVAQIGLDFFSRYTGEPEASFTTQEDKDKAFTSFIQGIANSWIVYHFHDTSPNARSRGFAPLHDWDRLRAEGENLAAYLYRLKNGDPDDQKAFHRIERLVGLGLPFFDRFVLEPTPGRGPGNEDVLLRWRQKGSDFPFTAQHLSDGSLRYILLTTALNQPTSHRPTTMVIDEPELGLHPRLMGMLAGQIRSAAATGQVVVATQSSAFLDEFEPEDVIVVDRIGAESRFRRLPIEDLKAWLEDYTLSDLVWKGVIGGGSSIF